MYYLKTPYTRKTSYSISFFFYVNKTYKNFLFPYIKNQHFHSQNNQTNTKKQIAALLGKKAATYEVYRIADFFKPALSSLSPILVKKIKTQKPLVGIILVFKKLLCEKNFSILLFFKLFKYKKYTHSKSFLQKKFVFADLAVYI